MKRNRIWARWLLLGLGLGGCDPRVEQMQLDLAALRGLLDRGTQRLDRIEEHLAYCSDEVKTLLGRVEKECSANLVCTMNETNLVVDVLKVDPSREGKFLSLMQERRHVVFYMPPDGRDLLETEKKQLRDMIKPAWLDDGLRKTRFLVVAHPEDDRQSSRERAERRARRVLDEIALVGKELNERTLVQLRAAQPATATATATVTDGEPAPAKVEIEPAPAGEAPVQGASSQLTSDAVQMLRQGRVLYWIFPFTVRNETLHQEDRPRQNSDRLTRSVWVYRVDC